ncbi:hypothetical protein, partial [Burkholderia pseudomallei]|uniref:hypothetical protein n=1 Tax=Burkholderia pseudomallei TaxID=28450 RepID=UPI0019D6AFAC
MRNDIYRTGVIQVFECLKHEAPNPNWRADCTEILARMQLLLLGQHNHPIEQLDIRIAMDRCLLY